MCQFCAVAISLLHVLHMLHVMVADGGLRFAYENRLPVLDLCH